MIMLNIDKDVIIVYYMCISLSLSNKVNIMGHETMFAYKSSFKFPNLLPKMYFNWVVIFAHHSKLALVGTL